MSDTTQDSGAAEMTKALRLAKEYRETMDSVVLRLWAADARDELLSQQAALAEAQAEVARLRALANETQPAPAQDGDRTPKCVDVDELRRVICGIGVVGEIDGHSVIRRDSVVEMIDRRMASVRAACGVLAVDALAQEIRRVDGNYSLGAGALAEALMPFLVQHCVVQGGLA